MRVLKSMAISIVVIGLLAGSTVGAAAQDEEAALAPAWVSGTVVFGTPCADPATSMEDGVLQQRGFWCGGRIAQSWLADDPRFTGDGRVAHDSDTYVTDEGRYQVVSSAFDVRNEDGGWLCANADAVDTGSSIFDASLQEFRMTCTGDGDYAGWTAILTVDFRNFEAPTKPFEGLVFPGEPVPIPVVPTE